MYIQELTLQTRHLAEQRAFYRTTLGLPVLSETATSFTVQAGTTRLSFEETEQDALYHIAFTIPGNTFAQAKVWLSERTPLLRTRDDKDEIFFAFINARSLYFTDANENILEFIAHYALPDESPGMFDSSAILRVSEIGLPVEDVSALTARLREEQNIGPYPASSLISEDFAFLGDIFGQFVISKIGRPWLPTETVLAIAAPVRVTISGQKPQQLQFSQYGYEINVQPG